MTAFTTPHGAQECGTCGVGLDPAWKFCVHCGTRVSTRHTDARGDDRPNAPESAPAMLGPFPPERAARIPAAIRPQLDPETLDPFPLTDDAAPENPSRPRFDLPLVLGIAIGVFGVAAMVLAFAIILGAR